METLMDPRILTDNPAEREREVHWQDVGRHQWIRMGIIGLLFVSVFHAELMRIVHIWISDASWSHGFLIPVFSVYLLNQHKTELLHDCHRRPCYLGLVPLIGSIAFYMVNTISPSGYAYFRSLSMVAALGAIVLLMGGWSVVRYTWLPVAYLLFAVPLPQRFYVAMTLPLRHWAATTAAALLDLTGPVQTSVNGVVIDIVYHGSPLSPALNVAEACSGMRLLMAFVALGVAMAYIHARPLWQRGVLLVCTVPIAVLCNMIRVTITGFLYVFVHPRYTHGIYHDLLGIIMLPLALGIYGLISWFMESLFVEEGRAVGGVGKNRTQNGECSILDAE